jgi:DNA replication protein DnaC
MPKTGKGRPANSRMNRPSFQDMSLQDLFDWHRNRGNDKPVAAKEYVPGPPATQSEIESWVYGFVESGGMRPEGAAHLLGAIARSRAGQTGDAEADQTPERIARQKRQALDMALLKAGLPESFWGVRLSENPFRNEAQAEYDFSLSADHSAYRAFVACRKMAHAWEPGAAGMTIRSADVGVGKTLFAYAALIYITAHHKGRNGDGNRGGEGRARCQAASAKHLLDLLRLSFGATWEKNPGVLSTEAVRQKYQVQPDVLLIDDLGKENVRSGESGEWARAELLDLLDYRMSNRLTTIITTNLTEADTLARYGAAFTSRLLGRSPAIEMHGPDYRMLPASENDYDPFAASDPCLKH